MAFVLDDILLSPIKLVTWIGENLHEMAMREITDDSKVQEELLELQLYYDTGEITIEEYEQREADLLQRLEAIQRLKERR